MGTAIAVVCGVNPLIAVVLVVEGIGVVAKGLGARLPIKIVMLLPEFPVRNGKS